MLCKFDKVIPSWEGHKDDFYGACGQEVMSF